jgi:hypothetical protein
MYFDTKGLGINLFFWPFFCSGNKRRKRKKFQKEFKEK